MSYYSEEFFSKLRPLQLPNEIRVGSRNDGGYVLPRHLIEATDVLVSLGYGHNSQFERNFLRYSPPQSYCLLYESSISLKSLAENLLDSVKNRIRGVRAFPVYQIKCLLRFIQMRLTTQIKYFHREVVANPILSSQVDVLPILNELSISKDVFLKMDIEGGEYPLFASSDFDTCIGMVIEFHEIGRRLNEFEAIIAKLKLKFIISHFHINNFSGFSGEIPNAMEITMVRKDFCIGAPFMRHKKSLPTQFDAPCNPKEHDIQINY